jgi:predicted Zn-dependent protease
LPICSLLACLLFFAGCSAIETISNIGARVGVATGRISEEEAEAIRRTGKAAGEAFERFTPEQEYYIGRAVGATVVSRYRPYRNEKANRYVNLIGQTLAAASDRPETFGGYHFLILDSDEVNAFAAPGGLIFVTRGMLRCCRNEDQVAAVLAHEIGHAQLQHGLRAIRTSRITTAFKVGLSEAAKVYGDEQVARLTEVFENSIGDIVSTLVDRGYSRKTEYQADAAAATILERVGYNPDALTHMLAEMKKHLKPGGRDFARTHPRPDDRIAQISRVLDMSPPKHSLVAARHARFRKALGGI